jgi:hypothetical protein
MELKIEKRFRDKHTKEIYEPGNIVEFTDTRAGEILADRRGLASVAADDAEPEEKPKKRAAKKPAKKSKE